MVILVLALLVLGPERLPQAARTMGRWMGELRKLTGSLKAEVRDVVDEVMRPVNETATVATDSFTSTSTTTDSGAVTEPDVTSTAAAASVATSGPRSAEPDTEAPLPADVPLPSEVAPLEAEPGPPAPRSFPAPPVDPSLN